MAQHFFVFLHFAIKHIAENFAGAVVGRGSQPAGSNNHWCNICCIINGVADLSHVIANTYSCFYSESKLVEPRCQPGRIGVDHLPYQQFVAYCEYCCIHGTKI
ncbi:hypothetical protein SDC9_79119 [bioreactor metagenome]|uniref:Uncharacterized protein n=1 Tax=bioreactor metagenome TaxID=1076179 RepID=A0A644YVE2_9ZZZZ